jgi:hypothetical protein
MKKRAKMMRKRNLFDSPVLLHAKKQRHLKELRKAGIEYSKEYQCKTKASKSPDGLKARKKRQEAKKKEYAKKQK